MTMQGTLLQNPLYKQVWHNFGSCVSTWYTLLVSFNNVLHNKFQSITGGYLRQCEGNFSLKQCYVVFSKMNIYGSCISPRLVPFKTWGREAESHHSSEERSKSSKVDLWLKALNPHEFLLNDGERTQDAIRSLGTLHRLYVLRIVDPVKVRLVWKKNSTFIFFLSLTSKIYWLILHKYLSAHRHYSDVSIWTNLLVMEQFPMRPQFREFRDYFKNAVEMIKALNVLQRIKNKAHNTYKVWGSTFTGHGADKKKFCNKRNAFRIQIPWKTF